MWYVWEDTYGTKQRQLDPAACTSGHEAKNLWTRSLAHKGNTGTSFGEVDHYLAACTATVDQVRKVSPKKRIWTTAHQQRGSVFAKRISQAQLDRTGASIEHANDVLGSDLRKHWPPTARSSLVTMLNGNTMSEWWTSLRACLGTKASRLHSEILTFCKAHELTREQQLVRRKAQDFLKVAVLEIWPDAEVHLFGSTATGLALPSSDIDVVIVNVCGCWVFQDTRPWISELGRKLTTNKGMFQSVTQILHAKIPILKAVFRSGLTCDISFDSHENSSRQGVQVIRQFLQKYEALRPLCIVLKLFLREQKLNEVFTGGIGSFCLTILIVSHLQSLGPDGAVYDLGALLVSFFARYSTMHNYVTDVVSARPGKSLSKQARGWVNNKDPERLAVENPLDPLSDVAGGSFNSHEVRAKFLQAKNLLLDNWHEEKPLDLMFKTCSTF